MDYLQTTMKSDDVAVAFVFCGYKERDQTPTHLLKSLLSQLACQNTQISEDLTDCLTKCANSGSPPSWEDCVRLLKVECNRFQKTFIIADALDELKEAQRTRSSFVAVLRALPARTNIMITSRPLDLEMRYLEPTYELSISATDFDIQKYVSSRIEKSLVLRELIGASEYLEDAILNAVVERTNGM